MRVQDVDYSVNFRSTLGLKSLMVHRGEFALLVLQKERSSGYWGYEPNKEWRQ